MIVSVYINDIKNFKQNITLFLLTTIIMREKLSNTVLNKC